VPTTVDRHKLFARCLDGVEVQRQPHLAPVVRT
jgi:hypothetical protein